MDHKIQPSTEQTVFRNSSKGKRPSAQTSSDKHREIRKRDIQTSNGKQVVAGFSAIHRKDVRPKIKYAVIYRHRGEYPVAVMCKFFGVSRSGYYTFVKRQEQPEQDAQLAAMINECQNKTDKTYGYRRVWKWLKDRNIKRNPKTVLRIMKKYGLLSEIRRRRKWVNLGQQIHKYENLLKRQFRADRPNSKWVTDISYVHTKEGVLYLSILPLIILFATGDNVRVLGVACIAVTVPVLAATIFFLFRKIGDTTHVDLNTVRGDEWDD